MTSKVLEHLQSRPIASIANVSSEIGNNSALKLICIIDYELEISKLYTEIATVPKLTEQLLNFHSLGSFKYISYQLPKYLFGNKLLRCKICQLVGPYVTVLEHMFISHNLHANPKQCMWCERTKIKVHVSQNTLNQCYGNYVDIQQLNNIKYPKVIKTFYRLLKNIARVVDVKISQSESFKNTLTNKASNELVVLISKKENQKEINQSALEKLYQKAMLHFYQENLHEYLVFPTNNSDQLEYGNKNAYDQNQSFICSNLTIEIDPIQVNISQSPSHFEFPHQEMHFDASETQLQDPPPSINLEATSNSSLEKSSNQFADFIAKTLGYIKNEQLREQTKSEIQSIVFDLLAQDMIKQITENLQNN